MKYNFRILLIGILFFISQRVIGQVTPSISEYDDESIRTFNIPELLKNFENTLNIISFKGSGPLDIKTVKNRLLYNSESFRTFYDDKVIVESDLNSTFWSNTVKEDLNIKEYLDGFNILYPKTEDPTVSFNIVNTSPLKKASYFYYNILYESTFNNKDNNGNLYKSIRRIAEVRLQYDTVWNAYIQAIRFAPVNYNPNDTKNNFKGFVTQYDQLTQYKIEKLEKKKAEQKAAQIKINQIVIEGDNYFFQKNYPQALEKYKAALAYDPNKDEIKQKIDDCEKFIDLQIQEKKNAEDLIKTIGSLKAQLYKYYSCYEFQSCKRYLDSLTVYYNQTDDTSLIKIGNRLSSIMPFVYRTNMLEQMKDYKGMLDLSTSTTASLRKKLNQQDSLLLSESLYRSARAIFLTDSLNYNQISSYGDEALIISHNAHLLCCQLLIQARLLNKKHKVLALELATKLVDNDPTNPNLRSLRADVFNYLNDPVNAIKEYKLAIDLKSRDSMTYINKAFLENSLRQYFNSMSTSEVGLKIFPCNHNLYYQLILAQEKLGLFNSAGKDFEKAISCGMNGSKKDSIAELGNNYYRIGLQFFDNNQYDSAIAYFNIAYVFSRNLGALFFRGYTYMKTQKNDQAINDLNNLIQIDSTYKHAFYMRGLINMAMGNHNLAIADFEKQIKIIPDYWKSYAMYGSSLLELGRYEEAAKKFIESNKYRYTDTIAGKAVYSLYRADEFEQANIIATKYINENKSKFWFVYKYKGLSEYKLGRIESAENDLLISLNDKPDDYDANIFLVKIYLQEGDHLYAVQYAKKASRICNDCPEALNWSGISIISQHQKFGNESGITKITNAIEKDSSLNSGSNLAWIAYGYLLNGNDLRAIESSLTAAKEKDPEDPTVLFVTACSLAESQQNCSITLKKLDEACAKGFLYYYIVLNDPNLKKCSNDFQFKTILKRYFSN